jgi:hypothetical protein
VSYGSSRQTELLRKGNSTSSGTHQRRDCQLYLGVTLRYDFPRNVTLQCPTCFEGEQVTPATEMTMRPTRPAARFRARRAHSSFFWRCRFSDQVTVNFAVEGDVYLPIESQRRRHGYRKEFVSAQDICIVPLHQINDQLHVLSCSALQTFCYIEFSS